MTRSGRLSGQKRSMSGSAQQLDQVRDAPTAPDQRRGDRPRGRLIYRHTALVRATHWINVVLLTILLMSGLQIFNAHPALYWGEVSNFSDPALSITAQRTEGGASRGITTVAGHQFDTTGWLGVSRERYRTKRRPRVSGVGDAAVLAIAGGRAALA